MSEQSAQEAGRERLRRWIADELDTTLAYMEQDNGHGWWSADIERVSRAQAELRGELLAPTPEKEPSDG